MTGMATTFGPSALATPANAVTMARVGLTPMLLAGILASGASWPALALWIALASTDGVDGYLARRHGTTRSGAFLDPLADKLLVLGALACLVAEDIVWMQGWSEGATISNGGKRWDAEKLGQQLATDVFKLRAPGLRY